MLSKIKWWWAYKRACWAMDLIHLSVDVCPRLKPTDNSYPFLKSHLEYMKEYASNQLRQL